MICNGVLGLCPGTSEASTKTMSISIHTVKTDVKGRYVILVVKVMNRFLPFVNLYVAPAFSLSYLDDMLQATYEIAKGKIFILEDLMQWWTIDRLQLPWRDGFLHMGSRMFGVFNIRTLRSIPAILKRIRLSRIDTILEEGGRPGDGQGGDISI